LRIFLALLGIARAEIGMRHQCGLGRDAEAADLMGGHDGGFGDFLGARFERDIGVGEEGRAALGDQQAQARSTRMTPSRLPMICEHVAQMPA
jgi:hypothetical protein